MRNWKTGAEETQNVAVLIFPRFSNHCLANVIEPLRAANDALGRTAYSWELVSLDGEMVESSSGMPVLPNRKLSDHPGGEFLFVASSYDVQKFANSRTTRAIQSAEKKFSTVAGLDTGAWLMAHAGLLEGTEATIHWDELTAFSETFPNVDVVADRFVYQGKRITCGGAMTAFDLILDLIGRQHGEAIKLEVADLFVPQDTQPASHYLFRQYASSEINNCLKLMSENIEAPLTIAELAHLVETNQKTLNRLFVAELGAPPKSVYRRKRLSSARRLAKQSSYTITEIALRCGYLNPAAMTRAFVEEFGQTPSALRKDATLTSRP
jgi:transcriptional regulator GlxA family with amidase domain